jgi:hypothetical protein
MFEGERWVTSDSSANGSKTCPDLRRIRSDIGFRRLSLDFPFVGAGEGVEVLFELPVSLSLMPLSNDVCDFEKAE